MKNLIHTQLAALLKLALQVLGPRNNSESKEALSGRKFSIFTNNEYFSTLESQRSESSHRFFNYDINYDAEIKIVRKLKSESVCTCGTQKTLIQIVNRISS